MGAPVIVYSGHMFGQGCAEEPVLAGRIAAALAKDFGTVRLYRLVSAD